ncbi:MAG TPA: folylpolyglutamate synthase/dihydrofolate synthase family protein [Bacteroidota bacterium]|nr:folylpolyglutamate synthase/dihydrofolate synthase family protein [Bacteroidota bacterium]
MSRYAETLRYLYGLEYRGMKFGLRNIRALLRATGNPQRNFPSIHIAGTNGKGSTSAFIASALTEAGYRTGLYTSPHLVRFTERIRIDGREIEERRLVEYVRRMRPWVEKYRATFFEATTCAAFLYFAEERVDVAVIETGLGGRLDATNVLRPLVSAITNIALEHTELLGTTIRRIAREKGGIIKPGVPAVTGETDPEALQVLRARARSCRVHLRESTRGVEVRGTRGGGAVSMRAGSISLSSFAPGLPGDHQVRNAALAFCVLRTLIETPGGHAAFGRLTPRAIRNGFVRVKRNTGLRGRLEQIKGKRRILLDVAHNPAGMRTLVEALRRGRRKNLIAVFGVMKDKEYRPMLAGLAEIAEPIIAVAPPQERSLPAIELWRAGRDLGLEVLIGGSVASGLRKAARMAAKRGLLVTGSHYVVGEALKALGRENT